MNTLNDDKQLLFAINRNKKKFNKTLIEIYEENKQNNKLGDYLSILLLTKYNNY